MFPVDYFNDNFTDVLHIYFMIIVFLYSNASRLELFVERWDKNLLNN